VCWVLLALGWSIDGGILGGHGLVGLYIWWLGTPLLYPLVMSASRRKNIYMSLRAGFLAFPFVVILPLNFVRIGALSKKMQIHQMGQDVVFKKGVVQ
jgi:hypothetical protein